MEIINLERLSRKHVILLNEISIEFIKEYNALIESIYNATDKNLYWLVSNTLSRNNYANSLFTDICYILLVDTLIKSNLDIQTIVVPSKNIKQVLIEKFEQDNKKIRVVVSKPDSIFIDKFKQDFRPLIDFILNLKRMGVMWVLSSKRRKADFDKSRPIFLLDTFFISNMFQDGRFKDRYYPGLLANLNTTEKKDVYFTPELLIRGYRELKKAINISEMAEEQFVFRIDYLKIIDYFASIIAPIKLRRISFDNFELSGYRLGPILKANFRRTLFDMSTMAGFLNYLFFRRLREAGISLRKVVDWNENQMIDRGFNKGLKDYYPEVPCVGYQGYMISSDFNFYISPTKYEVSAGLIPDEMAVIGRVLLKNPKRFYTTLKVRLAPAFRFGGVWKRTLYPIKNEDSNRILVALPISFKESKEILRLVIESLSFLTNSSCFEFRIKPHPFLGIEKLKKSFADCWPEEFMIVSGDFTKRLQESTLMVGNSNSSTCVEALALGIPVVVIGNQSGLTQNSIPKELPDDLWRICYTPLELANAIYLFVSKDQMSFADRIAKANLFRECCFEPVTKSYVRDFIMG